MDEQSQKRLEKWFDGEADTVEAREMEQLLESDPEARGHLSALRRIRKGAQASFQFPAGVADWESFEKRLDGRAAVKHARAPRFARLGGLAALIVLTGIAVWIPFRGTTHAPQEAELMVNSVELVETDLEDAVPVVYLDQPSGWTVVWVLEDSDSGEI